MVKRGFDILFSLLGVILLSPVLIFFAVVIMLTSSGPVFYRGIRVGRYGKHFRMFKFRTMVVGAENMGGSGVADGDYRITKLGRFLRKYKIDELPQLFNVLVGHMSFVGPRPEVKKFLDKFPLEERTFLQLRPGITDWASIWNSDQGAALAGKEDPDKAYLEIIRPIKYQLQMKYIQNNSLWVDMKIVLYTFRKLFSKNWLPNEIRECVDPLAIPTHSTFKKAA